MNPATAVQIADRLQAYEIDTLSAIHSIIHHPRSLARPLHNWRPPTKPLPGLDGASPLDMAITRHRVGEQVRVRVRDFGEKHQPAYLITVRITDPHGGLVDPALAEGWVRAILPDANIDAAHEVSAGRAPTFVWLVDGKFHPTHSPASLFSGIAQSA